MKKYFTLIACLLLTTASLMAQRGRHYSNNWRYYPVRGQHFLHVPGPFVSIQFGGNPWYYSGGLFYRPYGGFYELAPPPFGIHIGILPRGYFSLRLGGFPYFYFNGIFYRPYNNGYEVVQAPVGATVPAIPRDAQVQVIDGVTYYTWNGTFYTEQVQPNGEVWYRVEGKHGVLNTDNSAANTPPPAAAPQPSQVSPAPETAMPKIGDIVKDLPADAKTVVINQKKYYVTPDNVYYEELITNNTLQYKVVGK
ncbi:MAG TPA: DUF6515 family protein [Sediminibacterium sp.]|nr:DUF6515 family protein [Sediminibacterium sp.]